MNRDIDLDYLCELYAKAFNKAVGTPATKHVAGLLAVVDGTQPSVIYPRVKKPKLDI